MDEKHSFERSPEQHERGEGARILHELERSGKFVFHGSPTGDIAELEIRQPYDYTDDVKKEDGAPCVAATRSSDVAIFRALVNDDYTGFGPVDHGNIRLQASQKALDATRDRKGFVYVLSQEGFAQYGVHPTMEWRSSEKSKPVQIIEVTEKDLPANIQLIQKPPQEF